MEVEVSMHCPLLHMDTTHLDSNQLLKHVVLGHHGAMLYTVLAYYSQLLCVANIMFYVAAYRCEENGTGHKLSHI